MELELLDHGDPGRVELVRGRRAPPARYAVRLLDERDGESCGACSVARADEIRGLDTPAGPVPKYERRRR